MERVRIDHFRGLAAYWEIPGDAPDARGGHWIPGPGQPLIDAIRERFGGLPVFAEDLGVITPDVEELRDRNGLAGMGILQFGFGNRDSLHLPHRFHKNQVVYPGTHDNAPIAAWFAEASPGVREHVRQYLRTASADIAREVCAAALRSVADTAIVSMQDALGLGADGRMNLPGSTEGNWSWRMRPEHLDADVAAWLAREIRLSAR